MFGNLEILRMAQALATHAGLRQQAVAQNVAHADTPGYRARDVLPFGDYLREAGLGGSPGAGRDRLIRPDAVPGHAAPNGNTVSLEHEMTRAAAARGQHEMALGIYSSSRDLLRAALGR